MTDLGMPETRYAQSGDINIAYQTIRHGSLDIVIVPGSISQVEFHHELLGFTAFLHRLSGFARVVTFDKRGQGLSDRVSGVPSLEERMDDVRAVMDAVGSKRAVLLGFSEGSPMSVLFAATYLERVSHLILFGGYANSLRTDEAFEAFFTATVAAWGTGLSMKRVTGTHDGNEREMALLGK
ncbi:pimeloyl-ACP methyl ester carboxylesterase [Bradyrhizobium sp. AZCC 1610]|uniref:alpha/beta fold hydrolase n=1 Tax=Bradyrhizobium sp. AZCC 1610 TaxID=3117020 RepID=UPI002FEF1E75